MISMTISVRNSFPKCVILVAAILATACQPAPKQKPVAKSEAVPTFYSGIARPEREMAETARQKALETLISSKSLEWQSDRSKLAGKISPIRTFKSTGGQYCREFEERLIGIEAWHRVRRAIACRRDGQWIVLESS